MNQSEDATSTKKRRLHKRTIVVVLVAIVPWILIAIPGTTQDDDGVSRITSKHLVHGWPFVHLDATEDFAIGGRSFAAAIGRRKFFNPTKRRLFNTNAAQESVEKHKAVAPAVQLNLRLQRNKDQQWRGNGYWTNWGNWPIGNTRTDYSLRFIGLLLNLICVGVFALMVAALCEYKIRRDQRLLKYSIATLFVGMAFLAVCIACVVQMYRENEAQNAMKVLTSEVGGALWNKKTDYEPRFPLIVSQLLNHGAYPWGTMETSRRVKSGKITVDIDQGSDLQEIKLISRCARLTQHSVDLRVFNFNSDRQNMLHVMGTAKLVALYLDFDTPDQFELNLEFNKRYLKTIRLDLDRTISQIEQLEPFLGLPSLEWVSIAELSTEGTEFIWETKTKWPKEMEFSFLDDVPEKLREKLKSEFKARHPRVTFKTFE